MYKESQEAIEDAPKCALKVKLVCNIFILHLNFSNVLNLFNETRINFKMLYFEIPPILPWVLHLEQ